MSSAKLPTGGDLVVQTLEHLGIPIVFGLPGGQTLAVYDALAESQSIRLVTVRDERSAAAMADAVGRLGGVGVCIATTGPGVTNLLTGIGGAFRDSSSVLILACNNRSSELERDAPQAADHVEIFRPLTRWATRVNASSEIPRVIGEAYRRATQGGRGPVLVDFARDALETPLPALPELHSVPIEAWYAPPGISSPVIDRVAKELRDAELPVIWAGSGATRPEAVEAILALAADQSLPVLTTHNAMAAFPTDHPNVFGPLSRSGTRLGAQVLQRADLLIAIGNSLNGVATSKWTRQMPARIIQIDIDAHALGRSYPFQTIAIHADAVATARVLAEQISGDVPGLRTQAMEELRAHKEQFWREVEDQLAEDQSGPTPFGLISAMQQGLDSNHMQQGLDSNHILVVDAGNAGIWTHLWRMTGVSSYLKPVGFGNMGFSIPAAIAAKLSYPERQVIALVGDGSLAMTMGELETAVREQAPLVIVVMNDGGYGNIRQEQQLHYRAQLEFGVNVGEIDFSAVARACGFAAFAPQSLDEFKKLYAEALGAEVATLLDVRIDRSVNAWTHPLLVDQ